MRDASDSINDGSALSPATTSVEKLLANNRANYPQMSALIADESPVPNDPSIHRSEAERRSSGYLNRQPSSGNRNVAKLLYSDTQTEAMVDVKLEDDKTVFDQPGNGGSHPGGGARSKTSSSAGLCRLPNPCVMFAARSQSPTVDAITTDSFRYDDELRLAPPSAAPDRPRNAYGAI